LQLSLGPGIVSKSSRIHITFEGRSLETLFVARTKDRGFSLGFTCPDSGNIHLTVYVSAKDERIHAHITDPSARQKMVWSTQLSPDYFDVVRLGLTDKWVREALRLPKCWAMSPKLWSKVRHVIPAVMEDGKLHLPIEGYYTKVKLDFGRKDRWDRLPATELSRHDPAIGYAIVGGRPHIVIPLLPRGERVLCFTERQWRLVQERLYGLLGITEFVRYLELWRNGGHG
jgi:hypothetical protein